MSVDDNPVAVGARHALSLLSEKLPSKKTNSTVSTATRPIVLGLTGLQGSGKSTWASCFVSLLQHEYGLNAITISLDDFYKTHTELVALRDANRSNKLLRTRGQPGTHDEELAKSFFTAAMCQNASIEVGKDLLKIPSFDKSRFNGEGDRAPEHDWPAKQLPFDVIVFEGWCVGFQPLSESAVREKYERAVEARTAETSRYPVDTLAGHDLEHLLQVNRNLATYNSCFMGSQFFDCLVHLDTDDLANVYTWRLDQENALRKRTGGSGMTDEAVIDFVKGYMPAYELYLEQLRRGFFEHQRSGTRKEQVHVCLDRNRKVVECGVI